MTEMEKKVMLRLCAKLSEYVDLDTDQEARNLIDWVILNSERKLNNDEIRKLTAEYKRLEPDCRESIRDALEKSEKIAERRDALYEVQQELKQKLWNLEQVI